MPRSPYTWQIPPAEGFYTSELSTLHASPVRTFLPTGYEPQYPYPLVVFLHGDGGNDEQVLRLAPHLSRRNYICISLRGPVAMENPETGALGYGWGPSGELDSYLEQYLLRALEQTRRNYHVHSERIYLAGLWEGASLAYRFALKMSGKITGVVSLNGSMPRPTEGEPLFRLEDVRQLKVLIAHGTQNNQIPLVHARRDFNLLYSAGAEVQFQSYPTCNKLHPHMLRDVNRWIMQQIHAELDATLDGSSESLF